VALSLRVSVKNFLTYDLNTLNYILMDPIECESELVATNKMFSEFRIIATHQSPNLCYFRYGNGA
jgi:hypothetical protein